MKTKKKYARASDVPVQDLGIGQRIIVGGRNATIVDLMGKVLKFNDTSAPTAMLDDGRRYRKATKTAVSMEVM
jgi:hypothetical protein